MPYIINCSACGRPIDQCIGDGMCEPAARGFKRTGGKPADHCRPLKSYAEHMNGIRLFGKGPVDYRAAALCNDPDLTCAVERMCGSWGLCYVVRTKTGRQIGYAEDEGGAWASASGSTRNSFYDPDRPRHTIAEFLAMDRHL